MCVGVPITTATLGEIDHGSGCSDSARCLPFPRLSVPGPEAVCLWNPTCAVGGDCREQGRVLY